MKIVERLSVSLVFALGRLPLKLRRALAFILGSLAAAFPLRDRRIAELQLNTFLGPGSAHLVRDVYRNFCLTLLESLNLEPILREKSALIQFDEWESFRAYSLSGRGTIYLTGHVGNWDLLAAYMRTYQMDFHALGREARGGIAQALLAALRKRYDIRTLWRQDTTGVKQIVRELKRGAGIAALIDQDTNVASEYAPYFSVPAKTPSALVALGKRLGCYICTVFMVREPDGRYRIFTTKLDETKSCSEILTQFNRTLEDLVRRYPTQWVWFHKRWRSRPDGRKYSSREYIECLKTRPQDIISDSARHGSQ